MNAEGEKRGEGSEMTEKQHEVEQKQNKSSGVNTGRIQHLVSAVFCVALGPTSFWAARGRVWEREIKGENNIQQQKEQRIIVEVLYKQHFRSLQTVGAQNS